MASRIFISHSSKDQKVARTICTALENRGLTCWEYSRNVQPGQNFQEQIVRAIRAAKIMLLVFTANANSSNEIKKELAIASQNNLVVIPVRIEDVIPNEAFAYEFATRQWIDLFDDWENSIARLADLIATTSDDQPLGDQAKAGSGLPGDVAAPAVGKVVKTVPTPAVSPASFLQQPASRWAMIAGVAVIVVAGIAFVTLRRQPASLAQQPVANATKTSDPLRLDLVTDCDRLAALPGDPDVPQGVTGVLMAAQIDIVPALTACDAALRQYPDVVRFTFQVGRVAYAQKNYGQTRELFEKAAAAGSKGAMNGLGNLYQRGNGVLQDYTQALNWYQKAAAAGVTSSFANVGNFYFYGYGVPQDYAAARMWYEKAAAAGDAGAMSNLGNIYKNGNGVAQDYAAARTWYEKAAAAGNATAMNNLGVLYQNGYGVAQDYAAARTWYVKAAAAGYEPASVMIKQIDSSTQQSAVPSAAKPQPAPTPADRLGRVWKEEESGWTGVWTRRGTSSAFDAHWTHPTQGTVAATLFMVLSGNQLIINRTDITGGQWNYQGTMAADFGSVSGTYSRYGSNDNWIWRASIGN